MDKPRHYYPVTFKRDDDVILATRGYLEELKGEPHDTARIYATAAQELRNAVNTGTVSKNAFKEANLTVIESPDGKSKSYTDEQMEQLLDEYWEANKYKPTKNSRVVLTIEGGMTGGLIESPVNVTLNKLSDSDFSRVTEILDLLQTRRAKLDYTGIKGDFGYFVRVGDRETLPQDMQFAFRGGPFSKTPAIVEELEGILNKYVKRDNQRGLGGRS